MVTLSPVIHKGIYQGCQKTNITRSPSYSAHKSNNHKVLFHYNNSASKTIYFDLLRDLMTEPSIDACSLPWGPYFCFCSTPTIHHRLLEQESSSSDQFSLWPMRDDSAEIFFRSFLKEALVSSSGMSRVGVSLLVECQTGDWMVVSLNYDGSSRIFSLWS